MSSDEVIELSIEETQALRAKLGLAPLRGVGVGDVGVGPSSSINTPSSDKHDSDTLAGVEDNNNSSSSTNNNANNNNSSNEELSLSIEETNALRLKIGLPPLNNTNTSTSTHRKEGSSSSTAIHAPPTNTAAERTAQQRLEDAKAKREARQRLLQLEEENRRHEGEGGGEW